jgi:hypothetical protein
MERFHRRHQGDLNVEIRFVLLNGLSLPCSTVLGGDTGRAGGNVIFPHSAVLMGATSSPHDLRNC